MCWVKLLMNSLLNNVVKSVTKCFALWLSSSCLTGDLLESINPHKHMEYYCQMSKKYEKKNIERL